MRNSPTADQNTLYMIRYIHRQMSSPTSHIIVHHIMRATRVCHPPHPNGILSSTIQTGWALFSINTALTAIHMYLISKFACKQSTFQSVQVHNWRIKSRSGDGLRHLGMWWTIVLHISWFTVYMFCSLTILVVALLKLCKIVFLPKVLGYCEGRFGVGSTILGYRFQILLMVPLLEQPISASAVMVRELPPWQKDHLVSNCHVLLSS